MCGIAGVLDPSRRLAAPALEAAARAMTDAVAHRGPDGSGTWVDAAEGVALGHRRLAIVDLSPAGAQPMASPSGRYVASFNGELYNFRELRAELQALGQPFRGHSDTEVLLAAVEAWGMDPALRRANGMMALALWDRDARVLHLARDRFGKKPLYHGWSEGALVFGSELRAVRAWPGFRAEVDRDALAGLVERGYVPGGASILRGVTQVPPASRVEVPGEVGASPTVTTYAPARELLRAARAAPFAGDEAAALDGLDALLRAAVARRMVADVPVGALLSGGVDSSLVVALMQAQSPRPVRTFTIGFEESDYDEARHARAVAEHLGTAHTEEYLRGDDAIALVERLPDLVDEPCAVASQLPTYLISRTARRHVTVALAGDGGDEAFGGYARHFLAAEAWGRVRGVPAPVRAAAGRALLVVDPRTWDAVHARASPLLPRALRQRRPGEKLHKLGRALGAPDLPGLHRAFLASCDDPTRVVPGARRPPTAAPSGLDLRPAEEMMYLDLVSYLPEDVLAKVDRASMTVALEVRAPFLDPAVVAFAWSLPLRFKVHDGQGKVLPRRLLERYVPADLARRPKAGFDVPVAHWLRGPLRPWAEALLEPAALRGDGFDPDLVLRRWRQHLAQQRDWHRLLWAILVFRQWRTRWGIAAPSPGRAHGDHAPMEAR